MISNINARLLLVKLVSIKFQYLLKHQSSVRFMFQFGMVDVADYQDDHWEGVESAFIGFVQLTTLE